MPNSNPASEKPSAIMSRKAMRRKAETFISQRAAVLGSVFLAVVSSIVLYLNTQFFTSVNFEARDLVTTAAEVSVTGQIISFISQQHLAAEHVKYSVSTRKSMENMESIEGFDETLTSIMTTSPALFTIYHGDSNTNNVQKYSKYDDGYYLETRDFGNQTKARVYYEMNQLAPSKYELTVKPDEVIPYTYDVRLKSWYKAGIDLAANISAIAGPAFDSYVNRDLGNPPSFSLIYNALKPSSETLSVFRMKFRTDTLKSVLEQIDVGSNGNIFIITDEGVVIASVDSKDQVKLNEEGVAIFKTIEEKYSILTPEKLNSVTVTSVFRLSTNGEGEMTLETNNLGGDAQLTVVPLNLPSVSADWKIVVYLRDEDFLNESRKWNFLCQIVGQIALGCAILRIIYVFYEFRRFYTKKNAHEVSDATGNNVVEST